MLAVGSMPGSLAIARIGALQSAMVFNLQPLITIVAAFLLFGEDFWRSIINWEALPEAGTISAEDLDLFRFVETAQEAVDIIDNWEGAGTKRDVIPGR